MKTLLTLDVLKTMSIDELEDSRPELGPETSSEQS